MIPILVIGTIGYVLKNNKKISKKTIDNGINYNCSSIKITDKTKFHRHLESKILENLKKNNLEISDFSKINISDLILDIFKKCQPYCYKKFMSKKLNSFEKISTMLYFEEIFEVFRYLIFKNYLDYDLLELKLKLFAEDCKNHIDGAKETEDFSKIYDNFKITYKYPS